MKLTDINTKRTIGNLVNNIVRTMFGASWVLEMLGDHSVKYVIVRPLGTMPESNKIILNINSH